jgi:hypothetical protein
MLFLMIFLIYFQKISKIYYIYNKKELVNMIKSIELKKYKV